eukprot:COSAG02_NODE_10120_length_2017_cov_1.633472_2_plen_86_part_00
MLLPPRYRRFARPRGLLSLWLRSPAPRSASLFLLFRFLVSCNPVLSPVTKHYLSVLKYNLSDHIRMVSSKDIAEPFDAPNPHVLY